MATPARVEAAASLPVFLIKSRRKVRFFGFSFIGDIFWTLTNRCQFKKAAPPASWGIPKLLLLVGARASAGFKPLRRPDSKNVEFRDRIGALKSKRRKRRASLPTT